MFTNKTVLIVDDEEKSRLYLAELTHELFPELTLQFAASPFEALFIIEKQKIDLIFLDVEMPGMTGIDLLTQLREKILKTPVVFISAYKRAEFIQKALRLNAVDYIDKPVDPEELQLAIVKALKNSIDSELSTLPTQKTIKKLSLHTANGEMLFEPDEII
jgi:CheY-like chemotaxis protein